MPSPRQLLVGLLAATTLVAGCATTDPTADPTADPTTEATGPAPGTQVGIADADDIDPARLAPLEGLGPCADDGIEDPGLDTGPLPLPPAAIAVAADTSSDLLTAQGYSQRTPVEIMVHYIALDGWTILNAEDEVFEAEILVEKDGLRVFAKAQAVCARGSQFVMFASSNPDLVPAPAGAGG